MASANYIIMVYNHWSVIIAITTGPDWVNNVIPILKLTGIPMMVKD